MANSKPFVVVATFCENLLIEPDGVLSAIRVVDTYALIKPPGAPQNATPVVELKGAIVLKSGDVVGERVISLVLEGPTGERKTISPPEGWHVVFNGGEHGVNLRLQFALGVSKFGLCWFDVLCDGEVLTRIPLRLRQDDPQASTVPETR